MLTLEALTARRALIDESPDLTALRYRLAIRARPVIERMPPVPAVKALLSRDGGLCPNDGAQLEFDPWSPQQHRCPTCAALFSGPRHHAHWARAQHLWLAERAAHLATLHALTNDEGAAARSREILAAYYELYLALPNSDNVLGPSHLFFSTYLESIWILDYLAAAFILREMHALDQHDIECIDAIANEAAMIIAEFNEGMSNRQTWNSAALTAIGTWFGDEELAINAVESRTGLLGHLADGFGADGMWFEGENYHLFALRGLLIGMRWATTAGVDLLGDDAVATHLCDALMAPTHTALPDFTFPARKDARYGVSLAHPAYLECWEAGLAGLDARAPAKLAPWLHALYRVPTRVEQTYDAYLHDAGQALPASRSRADLSWWALLTMAPALPSDPEPWAGATRFMEQQGLAVLRHGSTYLSLECGSSATGHGHPDRLQLTLFSGGVHWLPDPGTGSYTAPDLFWYRSTLAHNAPMLQGKDQPVTDTARCTAFDVAGEWAWCTGIWNNVRRTLISGPRWTLDVTAMDGAESSQLDLPWHLSGSVDVLTPGTWEPAALASDFVNLVERFQPGVADGVMMSAQAGDATLRVWYVGDGGLLRATGPGLPGSSERRQFFLRRTEGNRASVVTVLDLSGDVTGVTLNGNVVEIREGADTTSVQVAPNMATIIAGTSHTTLAGVRPAPIPPVTFVRDQPLTTSGHAIWVAASPALDGSLRGFDRSAPLALGEEHHYFRTELPYPGPDIFSAIAYVNWSDDDLYVAVDVVKDGMIMRPADAPALNLDNEPDDINADSVQVYWRGPDHATHGWLVCPAPEGTLRSRSIGAASELAVTGSWTATPGGYRITIRVPCPQLVRLRRTERLGFDLIVNEMLAGRIRRAGQLIWSGGPGWAYLRGDRHDPATFGELELIG